MGWLDEPVQKGQQYTSEIGLPFNNQAQPEKVVNAWTKYQERRDQALEKRRAATNAPADRPELCWGGPSTFSEQAPLPGGGFNTRQPTDDPPPPEPPQDKVLEWKELDGKYKRKTEKIQIASENDPETYIVVERIKEITFTAPSDPPFNGKKHKFTLKHPTQGDPLSPA